MINLSNTTDIFSMPDEDYAIAILKGATFEAQKIANSNTEKRCDLLATDGSNSYLIEVKKREENEDIRKNLKEHGSYMLSKSRGYDRRIQEIIKEAGLQLKETGKEYKPDFNLVWFSLISELNREADYARLHATIYGIEDIFNFTTTYIPCLYFAESIFFAYRSYNSKLPHVLPIEGIVVALNGHTELCVNNYSVNYENFKASSLYKVFLEAGTLTDPGKSDYRYLVADCEYDRRKQSADVLGYIKQKYGLHPNAINFSFTHSMGCVVVPRIIVGSTWHHTGLNQNGIVTKIKDLGDDQYEGLFKYIDPVSNEEKVIDFSHADLLIEPT